MKYRSVYFNTAYQYSLKTIHFDDLHFEQFFTYTYMPYSDISNNRTVFNNRKGWQISKK